MAPVGTGIARATLAAERRASSYLTSNVGLPRRVACWCLMEGDRRAAPQDILDIGPPPPIFRRVRDIRSYVGGRRRIKPGSPRRRQQVRIAVPGKDLLTDEHIQCHAGRCGGKIETLRNLICAELVGREERGRCRRVGQYRRSSPPPSRRTHTRRAAGAFPRTRRLSR